MTWGRAGIVSREGAKEEKVLSGLEISGLDFKEVERKRWLDS